MNYTCYYRVPIKVQGRSWLGLGDERSIMNRYLGDGDKLMKDFTKVESGCMKDMAHRQAAIQTAKQCNTRLLIAKLDRLSRNVSLAYTFY